MTFKEEQEQEEDELCDDLSLFFLWIHLGNYIINCFNREKNGSAKLLISPPDLQEDFRIHSVARSCSPYAMGINLYIYTVYERETITFSCQTFRDRNTGFG